MATPAVGRTFAAHRRCRIGCPIGHRQCVRHRYPV